MINLSSVINDKAVDVQTKYIQKTENYQRIQLDNRIYIYPVFLRFKMLNVDRHKLFRCKFFDQ